jgi:hypothetical protein
MKNNFQFDYGATMAGATINEDGATMERLWQVSRLW